MDPLEQFMQTFFRELLDSLIKSDPTQAEILRGMLDSQAFIRLKMPGIEQTLVDQGVTEQLPKSSVNRVIFSDLV